MLTRFSDYFEKKIHIDFNIYLKSILKFEFAKKKKNVSITFINIKLNLTWLLLEIKKNSKLKIVVGLDIIKYDQYFREDIIEFYFMISIF